MRAGGLEWSRWTVNGIYREAENSFANSLNACCPQSGEDGLANQQQGFSKTRNMEYDGRLTFPSYTGTIPLSSPPYHHWYFLNPVFFFLGGALVSLLSNIVTNGKRPMHGWWSPRFPWKVDNSFVVSSFFLPDMGWDVGGEEIRIREIFKIHVFVFVILKIIVRILIHSIVQIQSTFGGKFVDP